MDEVRLNTLTNPGERATRARLEDLMTRIDRLSPADLNTAPIPHPDADARDLLVAMAEAAADRSGRGELLDEAREAVRDALLRRYVDQWPSRPYGSAYHPVARTEDQAAVITALEDAVAVAVTEDLLDREDAAALAGPGMLVLGAAGDRGVHRARRHAGGHALTREAALAAEADEAAEAEDESASTAGAPTAEDWAAADRGETAVAPGESYPAQRSVIRFGLIVIGIAGAAMGLAWGFTATQPLIGILLSVAVVAICLTLATYQRPGRD